MKFTGESGQVEVTLVRSKTQEIEGEERIVLEFCVSDTGCGITDSFKKRLFEPFCQFFNSSRGGGTGLGMWLSQLQTGWQTNYYAGLAISQNLVKLMQGKISLLLFENLWPILR